MTAIRAAGRRGSRALDDVGFHLGRGIGTIVNLVNPDVVVIGGLLREVYPVARDAVVEALAGTALDAPGDQVRLVVPHLGGDAVVIGAGELAWEGVLADPVARLRPAVVDVRVRTPETPGAAGSVSVAPGTMPG